MLGFSSFGEAPLGDPENIYYGPITGAEIVSGVCFPSYGRSAAWVSSGAWDVDFPVTNLSLVDKVRRVALQDGAGEVVIDFTLSETQDVDFLALVHHNGPPNARVRITLSSGTDPAADILYDSGAMLVGGSNDLPYPGLRPMLLSETVAARSGRITLSDNPSPWEIGAVEVGMFWRWRDVGVDRAIGFASNGVVQEMAHGADHVMGQWSPRVASGERALVDQDEVDETLLDFQRFTGRSRAFVWCWNTNAPETWIREAFLARNQTLPAGVAIDYLAGAMRYDFREHLS